MQRWLRIFISLLIIVLVDFFILGRWPMTRSVMSLSVCLVIITTLIEGLGPGLVVAAIAGMIATVVSVTTGATHVLSMMAVPLIVWFFSVRIVTTRSAVSFVSTIVISTATYVVIRLLADYISTIIDHNRLHLVLSAELFSLVGMCFIHPLLISGWWRLLGRGSYGRVAEKIHISF